MHPYAVLANLLRLVFVALLLAACTPPTKFNATELSGIDWGKDFALTDHHGQARRLGDFKGRAIIMFFGYTQCPDVCPTTLANMREVMTKLALMRPLFQAIT
jgi:protein SCO1/2